MKLPANGKGVIRLIYVTGDTHGDRTRFQSSTIKKLKKGDTLFICGDFGFLWNGGKEEQKFLKWLGKRRYQIGFLDGTHENFELLRQYEETEWNGGKARRISGGLFYLNRGEIYTVEGKTIFALGGGEGAPDISQENDGDDQDTCSCLPTLEELRQAGDNLKRHGFQVDYILTHECPTPVRNFLQMQQESFNHLHAFLRETAHAVTFRKWFFGSMHMDKVIPPRYVGVFCNVIALDD